MMHPNVVTVFDLGYHTDGPHRDGAAARADLLQTLREGPPLSVERKVAIILNVLDGLATPTPPGSSTGTSSPPTCSSSTRRGEDHGFRRGALHHVLGDEHRGSGGTADYMSPEQVSRVRVDGRSDLFSTAAMLCELLTGHRPFHGDSLVSILFRITHEAPRLDLPSGPEYEALAPILTRALAKDAAERYQTAAEFKEALRECRDAFLAASAPAASAGPLFLPPRCRPAADGRARRDRGPWAHRPGSRLRPGAPVPVAAAVAPPPTRLRLASARDHGASVGPALPARRPPPTSASSKAPSFTARATR
jgi:serine/threonine protein kinase